MAVKSPCINVCIYREGMCQGCFRTMEEIANWSNYTDKQKKEVLKKITERRPKNDKYYYGFP